MTTATPTPVRRRSTARRVAAVVAVVAGSLLVVAGIDRAVRDTTTSSRTFGAEGIDAIVVDTRAGHVSVTATDRTDVVVASRTADFGGETATVSTTAGEITVDASAATRVLELRTTAGSIEVEIDDREPLRVDLGTTVGRQSATVRQDPDADRSVVARTTAGEIRISGR